MLIVSSRAAQARLAWRNSSYSHFATTFIQRCIGATKRKSLNAGDVFTAFYSTIFAAAALVDSKAKENRLHEWDRLIAEAREGQRTGEERYSCLPKFDQDLEFLDSLKDSIANAAISENSESSHKFFGRPAWHLRKLEMGRRDSLCMQSIFGIGNEDKFNRTENFTGCARKDPEIETFIHEEPDFDVPERDISQSEELNALRANINSLVIRLLNMSTIYESPSRDSRTINDEEIWKQLEIMKQRLESLNVPFESLPMYIYEGADNAKAQVKDLNAILWRICRKATCEESSLNLMIAKICYNLLISAVPPNIETYNIIFHEFSLLELHELVEQVLQSFWFSRLRPNKRTIELIILHYKSRKDKIGLTTMVRKMRGSSGDLMQSSVYAKKYRKKYVSVDESHYLLQRFDPQDPMIRRGMKRQKFYFRSGYLYKKSPRDKHIFDALINTHLKLKGLRPAIRYISAAIREGSKIKANTLCLVISSCIKSADFTSGLKILMNILSQWTLDGYRRQIQLVPVVRFHICRLLFFCGIDPNKGVNGHLPSRITRYTESMIVRDLEFPKEALRKLLYLMKIESLKERLSRNSELIVNLGDALNSFSANSKTYDYEGINKAFHFMKTAAKREEMINDMYKYSVDLREGFKLRIRGLQSNYITSFSKMEEITTNIIMIRIRMCASRLNVMANMISHTDLAGVNMRCLQNLDLRLSILHMQVKVEIYLNKWWIRRLGFASSLSRSCTQRKRLNQLMQILTNIESKTNTLWDFCFAGESNF
ncbi:putative pentatricopeptide repeat domain-containing protein [Erysiphe neolycopersici]|uniref:Putative pentatricopeptide repeat domain-containing protein n=1 Tax=Erysiphe neolycopersici TaxID=212602 RepID=A0A420HE14_9PEZI|nr:putative pentatricopeptide repeat domain-containing protein [Erysiphe neolycopersici]